jgi:hypothetical protein
MSSPDHLRPSHLTLGRISPLMAIAIAEGTLVERYRLPLDQVRALLQSRAPAVGLPLCEVAHWLVATKTLPAVPSASSD